MQPNRRPLTGIFLAVIGRFLVSLSVVAAGLAAIVSVAALADGRAPDAQRFAQVVGGFAPAAAAVWVLLDLRRHQEDVALAGLGVAPIWLALPLLLCAGPLFTLDQPAPSPGIESTGRRLSAPELTIVWRDGAAYRSGDPRPYRGLPPPPPMLANPRAPLRPAGLRLGALALGLLGLLRWREPPGLIAGLAVAGLVFWAGR